MGNCSGLVTKQLQYSVYSIHLTTSVLENIVTHLCIKNIPHELGVRCAHIKVVQGCLG